MPPYVGGLREYDSIPGREGVKDSLCKKSPDAIHHEPTSAFLLKVGKVTFRRRTQGVFYSWRMVAVAIPLNMVLYGLTKRSYGLFFKPFQGEFGWSAAH